MRTVTLNIENQKVYHALVPFLKSIGISIVNENSDDKKTTTAEQSLTVHKLLNSQIVGLWKDRQDINDSASFARNIRNESQNRKR